MPVRILCGKRRGKWLRNPKTGSSTGDVTVFDSGVFIFELLTKNVEIHHAMLLTAKKKFRGWRFRGYEYWDTLRFGEKEIRSLGERRLGVGEGEDWEKRRFAVWGPAYWGVGCWANVRFVGNRGIETLGGREIGMRGNSEIGKLRDREIGRSGAQGVARLGDSAVASRVGKSS